MPRRAKHPVQKWRRLIAHADAIANADYTLSNTDYALPNHEERVKFLAAQIARYAFINRWIVRPNWKSARHIAVPGLRLFHRIEVREGAFGSVTHLLARLCIEHLQAADELWRKGDHEKAEVAIERPLH